MKKSCSMRSEEDIPKSRRMPRMRPLSFLIVRSAPDEFRAFTTFACHRSTSSLKAGIA